MIGKTSLPLLITNLIFVFTLTASAQSTPDEQPAGHFSIQESPKQKWSFETPDKWIQKGLAEIVPLTTRLNLLKWVRHADELPQSPEPYNRRMHFGSWLNDPTDNTCYNTRAKVLIRDSLRPVTFRANNKCLVDTGQWVDPYSGIVHTQARSIQIDHVVALKNAFSSGAWKWSARRRCLYANFMVNGFHLLSTDGHENMSKGDGAPDDYLPPSRRYVCQYLQDWLRIKLIWKLDMTPSEANAIRETVQQYGCNLSQMTMLQADLSRQRKAMNQVQGICHRMAQRMELASLKERLREASSSKPETTERSESERNDRSFL